MIEQNLRSYRLELLRKLFDFLLKHLSVVAEYFSSYRIVHSEELYDWNPRDAIFKSRLVAFFYVNIHKHHAWVPCSIRIRHQL